MASLLPVRISEDKNYRLCRVILVAIHKIFYTVIVLCLLDVLSLYTAFMPAFLVHLRTYQLGKQLE